MRGIYRDITQTVGNTPMVKINQLTEKLNVRLLAKLEFFNPMASIKDRIGVEMVEKAEKEGRITKGSVIIEPTSGNTGIALAFVCAAKGYKLILTMPETMSSERRSLLKYLGAELVLTEAGKGMKGAVEKAEELLKNTPSGFMPQQFRNPANPQVHRRATAQEIWDDTKGEIDIFVAGVGTGGTITGVGEFLKKRKKTIKIIALEPEKSPVLSGGSAAQHNIQGIGAGFIPETLNRDIIDEIIRVSDEDSCKFAHRLARQEGIFAGISSGAAIWASVEVAKRPGSNGKTIVTILPDTGERYLSVWPHF